MSYIFGAGDGGRRRQINLGGAAAGASQAALLAQARDRRTERDALKRRADAARAIQAWWRGKADGRHARQRLSHVVEEDPRSMQALRALVLIGRDGEALAAWAAAMSGPDALLGPLRGPHAQSYQTLLPRAALLLVRAIADHPQSTNVARYTHVLEALTTPKAAVPVLGANQTFTAHVLAHLIQRELYVLISRGIAAVPVAEKNAPALSPLISLAIAPFAVFGASSGTASEELYTTAFSQLFTHFLAVPLLPNRLPLASLTLLAKSLPFASLSITHQSISTSLASTSLDLKTHVLANLLAFVPPRYAALPARALAAYLDLLAQLLADVPPNTFEPASPDAAAATSWAPDSDDEDRVVRVERVDAFATSPMVPALALDAKTIARLGTLTASTHVHALVAAAKGDARPALAAALLALGTAWPARRARVLGAVHAQAGGALVRELYRGWVRGSPLGRDGAPTPAPADEAAAWPPLLFLVELYTHALLTMHDDEFFSATGDDAARNPLTLDELTGFSRQLLRVVFPLYWAADAGRLAVHVPGAPSVTYAGTRERITACLRALHARDSRKRFTPPEHWLMTSDMDAQLFVQAALYEAEQAAGDDHDAPRAELRAGTARARETAAFGPRLAVLHHIPFAVPFEVRVAVFRGWVWQDMRVQAGGGDAADAVNPRARWQRMFRDSERGRTDVTVRRGHIAQDGFDRLGDADLKGRIKITFIDEWGNEEAGIDGGGVFKEFFTSLCKEVFDTDRGLWLANRVNELYPNPHAYATEAHSLNWYRFIGRILGKAMYDGILVEVAFAPFFLAKWLGRQSFMDDLASLDPDLYHGLVFLKQYTGDFEDLALNFTAAIEEFGATRSIDLIPGGAATPVTRENALRYIFLVAHFRLSRQIARQSAAFFEGLSEVVDPAWLRMFDQRELQILLGGVDAPVDVDDLRAHTLYGGAGYADGEPTIAMFWKVVAGFGPEERRKLLKFVTSCSRPPLLGFKELFPQFAIQNAGADQSRLPTASTCVNLLKLPQYTNEKVMRTKLLQAINANAGFDLS